MLVLGTAFLLIYLSLGVAFLFFGSRLPFYMSPTYKRAFGLLLTVYALFRAWRLWRQYRGWEE
ncbi:MAG: hypothetical protein LBH06_08395 [Rikenellaceae bacterium]|jgi:hypothetical protein|nr:hypothetical protein [Rikenellaceae bacterium]